MTDTGGMDFTSGDDLNIEGLNNMVLAHKGWGIISDLVVTATTGMAISISKGAASIDGKSVDKNTFTSNQSISAADASYDRYDLVVINSAANVIVVTGTTTASNAAETPSYDYATNKAIPLAELYIPAGTSSMSSSNIKDMRIFVNPPANKVTGSNTLEASHLPEQTTTSNTFVLKKELTPTTTGFHHVECKHKVESSWRSILEIRYWDGSTETTLATSDITSSSYITVNVGVEITDITHTIRFYLRTTTAGYTSYIRDAYLYDITESDVLDHDIVLVNGLSTLYVYYSTAALGKAETGTQFSGESAYISNVYKLYVFADAVAYIYAM